MLIKDTDTLSLRNYTQMGAFPDQFVSEEKKRTKTYVKETVDYFANVAFNQYGDNQRTFVDNYDLVKGILKPKDFYLEREDGGFTQQLMQSAELPEHVQHYSILGSPMNTMLGELTKRPDGKRIKAFDDDSKNEELRFRTDIANQFIWENVLQRMKNKFIQQGLLPEEHEEEIQQMTAEEATDEMTNYTSLAERWGNRMLEALKMEFNTKELSEDAFRDLMICAREGYHVYEDNTNVGFATETLNPKEIWKMTHKDRKYISDPSNRKSGAYAAGVIRIMEISEIIQRFNISKEEIDFLRDTMRELSSGTPMARRSNSVNGKTGWDSIKYDTYSPLELEERMIAEAELTVGIDPLAKGLGLDQRISAYGNKFVVIEGYYESKIKIGKVTYMGESGIETMMVDEEYEKVPNQIGEVEWSWDNQWYRILKVGNNIYQNEPFNLLPYCPIIGLTYEGKNVSQVKSFVDMLKPFQAIYNVCLNQLWKLLEKEIGNVQLMSIRHIPGFKDSDSQDELEMWEARAREMGVVFVDDTIENTKGASQFNTFKNVDLTRSQEIQSRYNLAVQMKLEAWELVGITRQRLGSTAGATESATATQSGLSQSYAQTEPIFAAHEYLRNQWYQALLDAAQFVAVNRGISTMSYVTTEGEQAFLQIQGDDLRLRDLRVYVTSRAEDQQAFQELRQLAQAMLQNGATPADIAVLYTTNSVRQMKDIFNNMEKKREEMFAQQQQSEQAALAQQEEATQAMIQADLIKHQSDQEFTGLQNELDRLSKEKIAIISATGYGQVQNEDLDGDGVADALEFSRLGMEQQNMQSQQFLAQQDLLTENQAESNKLKVEMEKLKVAKANQANDLAIEKLRLQAAKAKSAATKKKASTKKKK